MKQCVHCHSEIEENRTTCPFCGGSQTIYQQPQYQQSQYQQPQYHSMIDSGSIGYWFLGFFIPIAGLILYFVWKDTKPLSARRSLWGALISWISGFVMTIVYVICIIILIGSGAMEGTYY